MARTVICLVLVLGAGLLGVSEAAAQTGSDWTDRPDAHAPVGVGLDHLQGAGEFLFTYRLLHTENEGTRIGADTIPAIRILQDYEMTPLSVSAQSHRLEAAYGVLDWFTVWGSLPFLRTTSEIASEQFLAESRNTGVGDLEIHGLFSAYEAWPHRAHISLGLSVPTGSIDELGVTPASHPDEQILPYGMQHGSGTLDLRPALTFMSENEHGTFGAQARAVVRVGENSRDYSLGHRGEATAWVAPRFNDWFSGSARLNWERWGDVSGADPELDPAAMPASNPFLQSGSRVDLPIGVNVHFAEGPLRGNRIAAEFTFPVHHDLEGPQLGRDWGFGLTVQARFPQRSTRADERRAAPPPTASPDSPEGEEAEDAPELGELSSLCLATGVNEEIVVTPAGDTLVGSERVSVREVGGDVAFPGTYAAGRGWFDGDEPVELEDHEYVRFGGMVALDCREIIQVGAFDQVPLFAEVGTEAPHEILYVPARPGIWQPYELSPEVRGSAPVTPGSAPGGSSFSPF